MKNTPGNTIIFRRLLLALSLVLCIACGDKIPDNARKTHSLPTIYPDYTEVTIPANIAPLRFMLPDFKGEAICHIAAGEHALTERADNGKFLFDEDEWHDLLSASVGKSLSVTVYAKPESEWLEYDSFNIYIAPEEIDSHLAYRLLAPGYEFWLDIGIYQRDLTSYEQREIAVNSMTDHNCMNCHSFCMQSPDRMMLHMRAEHGGTYILTDGDLERINGKVNPAPEGTQSEGVHPVNNLVYPSWHPSGDFIAFSSNDIHQYFHMHDRNRIEVLDMSSDVVVYDVKHHEVVSSPLLMQADRYETFPTFSPDGRTLYYCSAAAVDSLPRDFRKVKYSLCAISYDPATRTFGDKVDTLYNARTDGRSAKFPRVSPDGRHLVFTLSDYGNFSIWHKDADLYIIDLATGNCAPLKAANSADVDSYHSWSSNSRWMAFSSRRGDGLYTRPYFAYIDKTGKARKPFLLPQADPEFYTAFMNSYNIPELITGPVTATPADFLQATKQEGTAVTMR